MYAAFGMGACKYNFVRYLSDLCYLEIREGTSLQWQCPVFDGSTPSPRESHAAVTVGTRLLIYGGMNGRRLGDVWMLEVGKYIKTSNYQVSHSFIPQIVCSGPV